MHETWIHHTKKCTNPPYCPSHIPKQLNVCIYYAHTPSPFPCLWHTHIHVYTIPLACSLALSPGCLNSPIWYDTYIYAYIYIYIYIYIHNFDIVCCDVLRSRASFYRYIYIYIYLHITSRDIHNFSCVFSLSLSLVLIHTWPYLYTYAFTNFQNTHWH